jgi:hypothetical protein
MKTEKRLSHAKQQLSEIELGQEIVGVDDGVLEYLNDDLKTINTKGELKRQFVRQSILIGTPDSVWYNKDTNTGLGGGGGGDDSHSRSRSQSLAGIHSGSYHHSPSSSLSSSPSPSPQKHTPNKTSSNSSHHQHQKHPQLNAHSTQPAEMMGEEEEGESSSPSRSYPLFTRHSLASSFGMIGDIPILEEEDEEDNEDIEDAESEDR